MQYRDLLEMMLASAGAIEPDADAQVRSIYYMDNGITKPWIFVQLDNDALYRARLPRRKAADVATEADDAPLARVVN